MFANLPDGAAVAAHLASVPARDVPTAVMALNALADHAALPAWARDMGDDIVAPLADGTVLAFGDDLVVRRTLDGKQTILQDLAVFTGSDEYTVLLSGADLEERLETEAEGELDGLMAARHNAHGDGWDSDHAPDHRSHEA